MSDLFVGARNLYIVGLTTGVWFRVNSTQCAVALKPSSGLVYIRVLESLRVLTLLVIVSNILFFKICLFPATARLLLRNYTFKSATVITSTWFDASGVSVLSCVAPCSTPRVDATWAFSPGCTPAASLVFVTVAIQVRAGGIEILNLRFLLLPNVLEVLLSTGVHTHHSESLELLTPDSRFLMAALTDLFTSAFKLALMFLRLFLERSLELWLLLALLLPLCSCFS